MTQPKEDAANRYREQVAAVAVYRVMGLIDHPLTPKIVAWLEAVNNYAAYSSMANKVAEILARDLLNAALAKVGSEIEELGDQIKARDAQLFVAEQEIKRLRAIG